MRHNKRKTESRAAVFGTAAVATVLFLALLFAGYGLRSFLPAYQMRRIDAAIAAGDTARARQMTEKYLSEEQKLEYAAKCDYADALALFSAQRYDEAETAFAALGGYADSADYRRECAYIRAGEALEAGQWDEAAAGFEALGGYKDALTQLNEVRYRRAGSEQDAGHLAEALRLYLSVSGYKDAADKAGALSLTLTGESDPEKALLMVSGLSEQDILRREAFVERRERLPRDVLDVGFYHTVGLRADGTLLAAGDNSCGQCDVSAWRDITAIAAGAYHTVGLRADGSVVSPAVPLEGWTDILAVSSSGTGVLGLRGDGTVAGHFFRAQDDPGVAGIRGALAIAAGGTHCAFLLEDGSVTVLGGTGRGEADTAGWDLLSGRA